ncbi:hypothetical protein PsYK624_145410 [Phanerochaete sordida]|uniref:Uncharacterized protein n=1 Tax=Phanerochaete sordida TaxID=48140 RepID=A0A9P3GRZ5_9APHY|nr:hypothetical protein PsYK624_145410 [Phanerochaete sordida]
MDGIWPGTIYQKALSSLNIGFTPWSPERPVEIGDVGFFGSGDFKQMVNVMKPPDDDFNRGALPNDYEPLSCKIEQRTTSTIRHMIKMSKNISLKSPTLAEFNAATAPLTFPITFHFVANGGPGAVVLSLGTGIIEEVAPNAEFEAHFAENYRQWIDIALTCFSQEIREEDLVLVRGHTKVDSRWIAIALNGSGRFTVEVDEANNVSVEKEKEFPLFMEHGDVIAADYARRLHQQDIAAGSDPQLFVEEDQCLFFKYYTMKKRMWGSPKVVAIP